MADLISVAPYEALGVEICKLAETVINSQPKEVQAELWKMHLEDLKAWRAFWQSVGKFMTGGGV